MPRPPRLSDDELSAALPGLPLWSGDADGLRRTVELPSFRDAVAAIGAIADVAEEMDHHPVLVYCRQRDYLGSRVHLDVDRLRALDPTADARAIGRALLLVLPVPGG